MTRLGLTLTGAAFAIVAVSYGGLAGAGSTRHYLGLAFLVVAFVLGVGNTIGHEKEVADLPARVIGYVYWVSLATMIGGWLVGYAMGLPPFND